jgi:hypothetical protein
MDENTNNETTTAEIQAVTEFETGKAAKPSKQESAKWFRYICEACSGNAYHTKGIPEDHPRSDCRNCGAVIADYRLENFIPLTEEEAESQEALLN